MSIFFSVARMLINNPAGTAEREEIENFQSLIPPPSRRESNFSRGGGGRKKSFKRSSQISIATFAVSSRARPFPIFKCTGMFLQGNFCSYNSRPCSIGNITRAVSTFTPFEKRNRVKPAFKAQRGSKKLRNCAYRKIPLRDVPRDARLTLHQPYC